MSPKQPSSSSGVKWNEVTWYSKLGAIILFIGVVPVLCFYIGVQYELAQQAIVPIQTSQNSSSESSGFQQRSVSASSSISFDQSSLHPSSEPFMISGHGPESKNLMAVLVTQNNASPIDWQTVANKINTESPSVIIGDYDTVGQVYQGYWQTQFDGVLPGTYQVLVYDLDNPSHPILASSEISISTSTAGNYVAEATLPQSNAQAQSAFSASKTTGSSPLTVKFTTGSSAGAETIVFGDGHTTDDSDVCKNSDGCDVSSQVVAHTYAKPGTYIATLYRHFPSISLGLKIITVNP